MKNTVNSYLYFPTLVVVALVIILSVIAILHRVDKAITLQEQNIRNQAIDSCAQASKYTSTQIEGNTTQTFEEPIKGDYDKCLEQKHIQ